MKISVVIATFNRGRLLLDVLRDLSAQRAAGSFEVVVVDDGSRPPAAELLKAQRFPFEHSLIEQANAGPAKARHRGILAASGEIVVIVDDDMALPTGFLAAHRAEHEKGAEVVMGLIRPADDLAQKPVFERFHAAQLASFVDELRAGKPVAGAALCTGNVSFRRSRYLEIGGFDPNLRRSEDRDLGIRFQRAGARLAFCEQAYSSHRSDHTDRELWRRRAFLYGVYDRRISQKHADDALSDPWHYLLLVNPLSRPLLLSAVLSAKLGGLLSQNAMKTSEFLDRLGLERVAIKGTTLVFGLEYFMGVRSEYPSPLAAIGGLMSFLRNRALGSSLPNSSVD